VPSKFVGPPAPEPAAARQMIGREPERKDGLIPDDMKPLAIGILADLLSTEFMTRVGGGREDNPMPGMQSSAGRAGYGLAEMLLTHYLTRDHPNVRKAALKVSPAIRGTLAGQNMTIDGTTSESPGHDDRKTVWNQRKY
jgi:hypothetical protein